MSILDDAIREHLELKRAHGADEVELKKLEDEAFGPPERPDEVDPFAEAPTQFLGTADGAVEAPPEETSGGRREPNIADLQEPPPPPGASASEAPPAEPEPDEEQPPPGAGHTTRERQAIADQPTEHFDVEATLEPDGEPAAEAAAPSDEDLADAEQSEPRLASVDQIDDVEGGAGPAEAAEEPLPEEEEEDFFSEQRLSDELNQALETPLPGEPELAPRTDDPIPPGPHTEEAEAHYAEREAEREPAHEEESASAAEAPFEDQPTQLYDLEAEEEDAGHPEAEEEGEAPPDEGESQDPATSYEPETGSHDDVLEDTPDFLEDAPEDDDLWFEQRPPKDFDFDD